MDTAAFGCGRRDDPIVAYLVTGRDEAQTKPFSLVPSADGEAVIEGRLNQLASTLDAERWLMSAPETPVGRYTLLAPDIEQIAVGSMVLPREVRLAL